MIMLNNYDDKSTSLTQTQSATIQESLRTSSSDEFNSYQDPFQTEEQLARDKTITEILNAYYNSYKKKQKVKSNCQCIIVIICFVFALASIICLMTLCLSFAKYPARFNDLNSVVALVGSLISFSGLVFGLITVITKFAFPENDEVYITEIVKAIQENDYKTVVESHHVTVAGSQNSLSTVNLTETASL